MRVLVLHAHPVEASYSACLRDTVVEALGRAGHQVDLLSLYDEGFEAVLTREERLAYHDTAANLTPAIAPYVTRLRAADALVLVYPVWNFGMPAILKGFFDRVFVPGVAFEMEAGDRGRLVRIMRNIRKVAVVTTYGGNRFRAFLVGDPPRRVARRVLHGIFRPQGRVGYHALYDMNRNGPRELERFRGDVERSMSCF